MDRILRTVPFGTTVTLLALAILGMRWAIGCSGQSRVATASRAEVSADVEHQRRAVDSTPPRLLPAENCTSDLLPVAPPASVVFTSGSPAERSAASIGPELTAGPPTSGTVAATGKPLVESLSETSIVQRCPATDQTKPVAWGYFGSVAIGNGSYAKTNAPIFADTTAAAIVVERPREPAEAKEAPLPKAVAAENRSEQLERVAQQVDRQVRHGIELAGRGAYFAARSEFIGALRLVAEGLDTEQKSNIHGQALVAALTAMKEAEDFLPLGSRLEADLNLSGIIGTHRTPVLKDETDNVTPMIALRRYLTYAQEQFAKAAGQEVAGSMALYAMGKLHNALADNKRLSTTASESKAVVFYQAALLVYPKNYMAANDLGVLLARCGNNTDARAMLERSVALSQQTTTWQNLAVVYRQLGQPMLAERATQQAAMLRQAELAKRQVPRRTDGPVQWVDPQGFAQTSTTAPSMPATAPAARAAGMPPTQPGTAISRPGADRAGPVAARNSAAPGNARWATAPVPGDPWATPARPASDTYGPAPTPAAAERMSWGVPAYQR